MRKGEGNWDRLAWRREGSLKGASKQEGEWLFPRVGCNRRCRSGLQGRREEEQRKNRAVEKSGQCCEKKNSATEQVKKNKEQKRSVDEEEV